MKKFIYIVLSALLFSSYAFSQGEVEAYKYSRSNLYGTARGLAMGGAFGALGGDQTGIAINPAGIAVYRSSEIAGTLTYSNEMSKVKNLTKNATDLNINNLGFVSYFPLRSDVIPLINFGFTYNNVKSYNKDISAIGASSNSLVTYMSNVSNVFNGGKGVDPKMLDYNITKHPFEAGAPWLSIFGYNSYLIDSGKDKKGFFYNPIQKEPVNNSINITERGSINKYDFTVGTTIANKLNIGLTLNVTDIYYSLSSEYSETFKKGADNHFVLKNILKTEGAGVGGKIGIIYRPVNSIRLGLAYHSPVFYTLTDTYCAEMDANVTDYEIKKEPNYKPTRITTEVYPLYYRFKTSDKWEASIAGVFGNKFIASLDYELTNYNNMKLIGSADVPNPDEEYSGSNKYISDDYKSASAIRVGLEYRFTPQFSGRLGYAWRQNPYETKYRDGLKETSTVGSTTIYRIDGDANYFTSGIGYRFNRNFYLDLAVVCKTQKDELYSFPNAFNDKGEKIVSSTPFELINNNIKGALTLGYKF